MARDSGYPQNTAGNIAVDFVWGGFPMQPDDDRTGNGSATVVVAADAAQNKQWSGYSVKSSPALTKTSIDVTLSGGLTSSVPNNHSVAVNNWNGYPNYTPEAPYTDTIDQAAVPNVVGSLLNTANSTLVAAGFTQTSTTTTVGATSENSGTVKSQTPAAAAQANLGSNVALVVFDYQGA